MPTLLRGGSDERLSSERIKMRVELQLRRQELLEGNNPPQIFFILDEAVVRRPVGGRSVMRSQVRRMIEAGARPNVSVEVVPFSAGFHPGLNGPFIILEFPHPTDGDMLYVRGSRGNFTNHDDLIKLQSFRESFEVLRLLSRGPEGSAAYLDKISTQFA